LHGIALKYNKSKTPVFSRVFGHFGRI